MGRLGAAAAAVVAAASAAAQAASPLTDTEAVALAAKHCAACHAEMPTHDAFDKPPKGIRLETIEQLRRHAGEIVIQVVIERAMPLGNENNMTDEERDRLGAWAEGRK